MSIIAEQMHSIIQVSNMKKIYFYFQVELKAQHARESGIKIQMYKEYHNFTCRKIQHLTIMKKTCIWNIFSLKNLQYLHKSAIKVYDKIYIYIFLLRLERFFFQIMPNKILSTQLPCPLKKSTIMNKDKTEFSKEMRKHS